MREVSYWDFSRHQPRLSLKLASRMWYVQYNGDNKNIGMLTGRTQYFTHERGTYMGLYALFLAGSNYFAPVICGFIAQYQGWQWVFYWPSIFIGFAVVFLFFFMEETNYVRTSARVVENGERDESPPRSEEDQEKTPKPTDRQEPADLDAGVVYKKKTYVQKLALINTNRGKNNMFHRVYQTLYFLGWPVIFYAGYVLTIISRA